MTRSWVKQRLTGVRQDFVRFPLYLLSHPFKGFDEMKFEKKGKLSFGLVTLCLICLLNIIDFAYTGFVVNYNVPYYMNSVLIVATTALPILLFTVANWSVTTLIDGIGKLREIFLVNMYALYITLALRLIYVLLSNILTLDEIPIAVFFTGLATVVYCLYVFIGLIVVHDFTFSKAVGSLVLTFLAMVFMIFIAMLLASLLGEVVQFVVTVANEIRLKVT